MTPLLALAARLTPDSGAMVLATASTDPTTGWLAYGPMGLFIIAFMTGYAVPKPTHDRVVAENLRLRTMVDDMVWPAIQDSTAATREATATIKEAWRRMPGDPPPRRRKPPS